MPKTFNRSCRTCGWTGTYVSAGRGDYAKRIHSCEKHLAKAAAHARGEARRADVDRTPKPCLHKQAHHEHGTRNCYVRDSCRCDPCASAATAYERDRTRQQAYGRWDNYVDADPARDHVRALMAAGMGLKRICEVGGASGGQLWKLLYGKKRPDGTRVPSRRIMKDVSERLLAVRVDLADGALVDATDTTRRLQALVALGWSQSKLAVRLGLKPTNFGPLVHGRRAVTVETARAVHALYAELVDCAPPRATHRDKIAYARSVRMAAERGWTPPLRVAGRPLLGSALPPQDDEVAS